MITDITRDRNNNMWVGTYNGLYKHEGSRIRAFNKVGKDGASISGLEMHTIHEDKKGFIWVGTTNGVDKIDPFTYRVQHIRLPTADPGSAFIGYIYAIFQDGEGNMWIGTDAAMFKINYSSNQAVAIPTTKDKTGMPSHKVGYKTGIKDKNGIWIYTGSGMVYYEYKTKYFYHRYHNPRNLAIFKITRESLDENSSMATDNSGNIWTVLNQHYLLKFNPQNNLLDSFKFERPANAWFCCYSIKCDRQNNIWLGFRHGGILYFNSSQQKFVPIVHGQHNNILGSNYVYSIEEDYQGKIWVATDNGIDIINYYNNFISTQMLMQHPGFTSLIYQSGDISSDAFNNIYIPFYQYGFFRYNVTTGTIDSFKAGIAGTNNGTTLIIPDEKAANKVWAARENKLLPLSLGATAANTSVLGTSPLPAEIAKQPGDVIWMYQLHEDNVFIRKNKSMLYHYNNGNTDSFPAYGWRKNLCLSKDSSGLWYINKELNLVHIGFHNYTADTVFLQALLKEIDFSFSNPRAIADDGLSIWITSQNGMLRYCKDTKQLVVYDMRKGLAHNFCYAVHLDKQNRIWVSSFGGIHVLDEAKDIFRQVLRFPTSSYMETFGSINESANGQLVFHAGNNLFIIDPAILTHSYNTAIPLLLQEFQVNGVSTAWKYGSLPITLHYQQNRIMLRFGLLNFAHNEIYSFSYKLHEKDKTWINNGNSAELLFNSLQPGNYHIQVIATNVSGNAVGKITGIKFTIRPPFWQTWWFRIIALAFIIFLVYLLFKRRLKVVRKKAAIQQQLAELEGKALRAQMNPHFIFNSLNAIQECIVSGKVDAAYYYLARFSKLLRMVLNNSEKDLVSLQEETDMLSIYLQLESLRFKDSFNYHINIGKNIESDIIEVPPLLLQPYIENAIWHGLIHREGEKTLHIDCTEKDGILYCSITDNGIGRKKAAEIVAAKLGGERFESKGMKLSEQRIRMMNLQEENNYKVSVIDLVNEEGHSLGTRVIFELPQSNHTYDKDIGH